MFWSSNAEGVYTYCIDQGSPMDENFEFLRYRDLSREYDLIECEDFYTCKERAESQVQKTKALLKNIIMGNQKLSNQFGYVIALAMVCVYDTETKSIIEFV